MPAAAAFRAGLQLGEGKGGAVTTSRPVRTSPYLAQWVFLGLFLLALGLVLGLGIHRENNYVQRNEEDRLATQAEVVGRILGDKLSTLDSVLAGLRRDWRDPELRQHFASRLRALVEGMSGVRTLVVFDEVGDIVAASNPKLIGRNFSYREYFQIPFSNPDPELLFIAPPFRSVLDGSYLVTVEKVMPGADGGFGGIVSASLDPEFFAPLLRSVNYAPDMWMSLATSDGLLFMMEPLSNESVLGMDISKPGSFFSMHLESGRQTNVNTGTVYATGQQRMVATRTVTPAGVATQGFLVVAAARDMDAIFIHWREDLFRNLALFLLLCVASCLGLLLYQHRRREFDRATREAQRRTRLLLTSLSEGVYGMDEKGDITFINPAAVRLLGYDSDQELLGKNAHDIMHHSHPDGAHYPQEDCPLLRALQHNEIVSCAAEVFWRRDGTPLHVQYTGAPLASEGRNQGAVVAFSDISERLQAEEELRQARDLLELRVNERTEELRNTVEKLRVARDQAESASRMKSDFLASVGHELRTPLNGILGMQQLLADTSLDEEQQDYLRELAAAAARLQHLVEGVIQVTGLENYTPRPAAASLQTFVDSLARTLAPMAAAKGLQFVRQFDPGCPEAFIADQKLLQLVLTRVLENAVKFTHHGVVTLGVAPDGEGGGGLVFVVSDTGQGIPPERLEAVAQGLTQASSSLDRSHGGLGLGLETARKAAALLGGVLAFHSVPGEGTTVILQLPGAVCDAPLSETCQNPD